MVQFGEADATGLYPDLVDRIDELQAECCSVAADPGSPFCALDGDGGQ